MSTLEEDATFEEDAIAANQAMNDALSFALMDDDGSKHRLADHRCLPRKQKRIFRHDQALHCIRQDYLGIPGDNSTPLFTGNRFDMMFRCSRPRFDCFMEDFGASGIPFYTNTTDAFGKAGASLEAKLLLPLKTIAYGVPSHTFTDYFQMSETLARDCCTYFFSTIRQLYAAKYLRVPNSADLLSLSKLHEAVHGIRGLIFSLDCMHTSWKNCPVAYQGSFTGKEGKPTIVLEGGGGSSHVLLACFVRVCWDIERPEHS